VFGFFKNGPQRVGDFRLRVFAASGSDVSVTYYGQGLSKSNGLFVRGLYAAKMLYTLSDDDITALVLAAIMNGCRRLDERKSIDVGLAAGVTLVSEGRSLFTRHREVRVDVYTGSRKTPAIQTHLPNDLAAGDVIATIAAFNEAWLHQYDVSPTSFTTRSYLQFFHGFLQYYYEDPLAYRSPQSIIQAPQRGILAAYSTSMGVSGLAE